MQLYLLVGSIYVKAVFSVSFVGSKTYKYENKEYCSAKIIHWDGRHKTSWSIRHTPHRRLFSLDQQPDDDKFLIMK